MTLREQFEAWIERTAIQDTEGLFSRSKIDPDRYVNPMLASEWRAYQAGHAASGREELLAACKAALDNDEVSEGFGARNMEDDLRQQLRDAIQKAEAL